MKEQELNKKFLEHHKDSGYIFWYPPKAKYRSQDIFGIFDFVAIDKIGNTRYYQITTYTNAGSRRRRIQNFIFNNLVEYPRNFYLAVWVNHKHLWRIEQV